MLFLQKTVKCSANVFPFDLVLAQIFKQTWEEKMYCECIWDTCLISHSINYPSLSPFQITVVYSVILSTPILSETRIPFSGRSTFRFPIESQTLTIWPCNDLDFQMTLTLDLTQLPWYSNLSYIWCTTLSAIKFLYELMQK